MSGNLLVRFDEGRVGRTFVSPSLLLYRVRSVRAAHQRTGTLGADATNRTLPRMQHALVRGTQRPRDQRVEMLLLWIIVC
jgi:hypothetical protein